MRNGFSLRSEHRGDVSSLGKSKELRDKRIQVERVATYEKIKKNPMAVPNYLGYLVPWTVAGLSKLFVTFPTPISLALWASPFALDMLVLTIQAAYRAEKSKGADAMFKSFLSQFSDLFASRWDELTLESTAFLSKIFGDKAAKKMAANFWKRKGIRI